MLIACMRCGEGIEVDEATLKEATNNGVPLQVTHEVCPRDAVTLPKYRMVIQVFREVGEEEPELLATVGETVEAQSYVAAIPRLTQAIATQWERARSLAAMADQDPA